MSPSIVGAFPATAGVIPDGARPTQALWPFKAHLPLDERDRRWARVRAEMDAAGLDGLLFLGNDIFWGTGMANTHYVFQVDSQTGAKGWFDPSRDPVVWNCPPHMNRPTNLYPSLQNWVSDIRMEQGMAGVADEIRARQLDRGRLGYVGFSSAIQTTATLLAQDLSDIHRLLPGVEWVDATNLIQNLRVVKSEAEIALLREASRISRRTLDAMVATARPGVPDAAVYAEMIKTQIANGADPLIFNLFAAGPVEHPPEEIWHLLHGAEQPLAPSMRPLAVGDLIVAEWHTKYGGYRSHAEYTVYLGKRAPDALRRIWDVAIECLEASKSALVAGNTLGEAWRMIRAPARRADIDWVELGFHAMGIASPEFPTVIYEENYGTPALNGHGIEDYVLQEGMTFGNNIDLHDSRWKVDVGVMLSDFMVVRPKQAECLLGVPTELAQLA